MLPARARVERKRERDRRTAAGYSVGSPARQVRIADRDAVNKI